MGNTLEVRTHELFAVHYARTGNIKESAILAGISEKSALRNGKELLRMKEVNDLVLAELSVMKEEQEKRFRKLADLAQVTLEKVMRGDGVDPRLGMAMVQAANSVLDRSGFRVSDKGPEIGVQPVEIRVTQVPDRVVIDIPAEKPS